MFKTILIAIDDSEQTEAVVQAAIDIAQIHASNIVLLNVLTHYSEGYPSAAVPIYPGDMPAIEQAEYLRLYEEQWQRFEQTGLDFLKVLTHRLAELGIEAEPVQLFGEPGAVICQQAEKYKADLIVLGRRGLSGLKEVFLGSVSNYVLHHAPCSVLAVRRS